MSKQAPNYPKVTDDTVRYRCDFCGKAFLVEYKGWYLSTPCIYCKETAKMFSEEDEQEEKDGVAPYGGIISGLKDNITGIGYDQMTGKEVAVTDDGKRIPVENSIYDTKRDKWGWAATGKKIKGYQKGYKPHGWKS